MMFVLWLNPMTDNCESRKAVAKADTREALEQLLERECIEPYQDGCWHKIYRKGGPLEWYNAPADLFTPPPIGIAECLSEEQAVERTRQDYREWISTVLDASMMG
jgi:hypothetical protein